MKINLVNSNREEFTVTSERPEDWRCPACDTLLGVKSEGRLHIRYKAINLLLSGSVIVVCRKCARINSIDNTQTAEQSA